MIITNHVAVLCTLTYDTSPFTNILILATYIISLNDEN